MDNSMISTILWVGAGVVLVLFILRRRSRKVKQLR